MTKNKQAGIVHLGLMAILAVALMAGIGVYVYGQNSTKQANVINTEDTDSTDALPSDIGEIKTLDEIEQLVQEEEPDAEITSVELDNEDSMLVFRVVVDGDKTMVFNARSGKLVRGLKPLTADGYDELKVKLPENFEFGVTFAEARVIAEEEVPGAVARKIRVMVRGQKVSYKVYFLQGFIVDVDASNGDVLHVNKRPGGDSTSGGNTSSKKPDSAGGENRGRGERPTER